MSHHVPGMQVTGEQSRRAHHGTRPSLCSRGRSAHSGGFIQHRHAIHPNIHPVTSLRAPGQAERQAPAPPFHERGHQGRGEKAEAGRDPGAAQLRTPAVTLVAGSCCGPQKSHLPGGDSGLRTGTG